MSGVPDALPAVVKATRLQEKAKQVGFEWDDSSGAYEKIKEELEELGAEVRAGNKQKMEQEFGDMMFSMINYARYLQIDAEAALEQTNRKFKSRFQQMEALAAARGLNLASLPLTEQDELWNEAKAMGQAQE